MNIRKILLLILPVVMLLGLAQGAYAKYVYAKMEQSWWKTDGAAIGAHSWGTPGPGTTWPGVRMTSVEGESDTWYITLDTDKVQNVIFTRVNGSGNIADWGAKTKDQTIPTEDENLFTITSSSAVWGDPGCDGTWSAFALTPTAVTLTVTDAISGTGTSEDPYIVEAGGLFTLSASNVEFSTDDPDMEVRYAFGTSESSEPTGESSTSEQTASSTIDETIQYYVSVRGYHGDTYSSSYTSASVYVKTTIVCDETTKKIGYYMPFASESQFRAERQDDVDQHPELNAYNWFKTNYVYECTGEFITPADIDAGISVEDFSVIWVNVDPSACGNLNDENLSVERIRKLGNYVKQGGNLYLSKRAVQALRDMDPPRFNHKDGDDGKWSWGAAGEDGYVNNGDTWTINPHIGWDFSGGTDRSSHGVYKYCTWNTTAYDYSSVPLVSGSARRTDNNTMWLKMFNANKDPLDDNNQDALTIFENDWNCRVLAVWGHVRNYCAPGMIEWLPMGDYQGKIIANGFAAYQWGTSNPEIDNVHNLTKGILEYLSTNPELPDITGLPTETVVKCATETLQLTPACDAPVTVSWSYSISDETVATVSNTGLITAVGAGSATITVTASADGYTDRQAEVAVTVNAGPTITMTPTEPTAYEVITLSTTSGDVVTWTTYDEEAYFVLNHRAVDGDSAEAGTIVLKAPAKATPYTITAQVDGGCASSKDITITVPIEYCH